MIRLHARASQGHRGSRLVLEMFQRPDILLTTTLVGTNISVVTLTTLGTLLMIRLFGAGGELYATLLFAPLLLVFGEVVPKSIYQQKANQIAPVVVYPLRAFRTLLYPLILAFSFVSCPGWRGLAYPVTSSSSPGSRSGGWSRWRTRWGMPTSSTRCVSSVQSGFPISVSERR
jgi:Mg2+/Co2+ transporter CorB